MLGKLLEQHKNFNAKENKKLKQDAEAKKSISMVQINSITVNGSGNSLGANTNFHGIARPRKEKQQRSDDEEEENQEEMDDIDIID